MKTIVIIIVLLVLVFIVMYALRMRTAVAPAPVTTGTSTPSEQLPVTVHPISHATMVLDWSGTIVYVDPTGEAEAFRGQPAPHVTLVTDIHGDHLSTSTLAAIAGTSQLVVPQAVYDLLPDALKTSAVVMKNGEMRMENGLSITAVPMYNLPESTDSRHPKGRGNGYVIERNGFQVYIAGDTAGTPEMRALTDIDIAFIPMNLPYTMGIEEAANAVLAFKPKQVYPYHYRGQDGLSDVGAFKTLVETGNPNIEVVLRDWYPQQAPAM